MATSISSHLDQPTTSIVEQQIQSLSVTPSATRASLDGEVHQLNLDNRNNSGLSYYKAFSEAAGSVTAGTTAPSLQVPVPGLRRVNVFCLPEIDGVFTSDYTDICVTEPGTAGATGPSSSFHANVIFDA